MRTPKRTTSAILVACAVIVTLAGCGATATESAPETKAETSASTAAGIPAPAGPGREDGPQTTIADYVAENKIVEAPVTRGEPGTPTFEFPIPADWRPAGDRKPEWAYGAVIYDKAKDPADPPFMTAIVTKLSGDVDKEKVLEYAPGMLQNLPGYTQDGDVKRRTLGGFESIVFQGSYLREKQRRYIAQETAVIPASDGALFVLQLNADAPEGQGDVVREAAKTINAETRITAP